MLPLTLLWNSIYVWKSLLKRRKWFVIRGFETFAKMFVSLFKHSSEFIVHSSETKDSLGLERSIFEWLMESNLLSYELFLCAFAVVDIIFLKFFTLVVETLKVAYIRDYNPFEKPERENLDF